MKKAYKKAIQVVESCENMLQLMSAFNYVYLFHSLYEHEVGCEKLTKLLRQRASRKRKKLEVN